MKQPITLALSEDVRATLDQLAIQQERSRSWIADRLIRDGLAARGQPQLPGHGTHQHAAEAAHRSGEK